MTNLSDYVQKNIFKDDFYSLILKISHDSSQRDLVKQMVLKKANNKKKESEFYRDKTKIWYTNIKTFRHKKKERQKN